jgi:hypothetical protein
MRCLIATLASLLLVSGIARADTMAPPWLTFTQATPYIVNADEVACPDSPTESVVRALFRYDGDRYAYMAKHGRWVLWRLQKDDLANGESKPDHVWFGDQRATESHDVMNVVMDMTWEEASRHFTGPCSWLDPGDTL